MTSKPADAIFVFPPAHGNAGVFKNHLGVAYLRAALAKDGITTAQYLSNCPGTVNAVAADILERRPRVVGFTVYDANFSLALSLSRTLKQQQPDLRIVFGGPTATFGAEAILARHPAIDACVMGEAEETGAGIFTSLLDGGELNEGQLGLAFRRDGAVICNELAPLVGSTCPVVYSALDTTPSPYLSGALTDGRVGVLSGRGCTHQCQYCVFAALGRKKLRLHSVDRVLAELEVIEAQQKRTGDRYIVPIHDDAFTLLPKRAKELCQAIIDRGINLVLSCITRADAVDDELLQLLRGAGFMSVAFGLESAVPSVLRATGKVRPPDWADPDLGPERRFVEQVRTSVVNAKALGFNVGVSIILGLPSETAEDGAATLRFVKTLPVDFYMHNFLWVFPGTPLWDTHERYGIESSLNPLGLPITTQYAYDVGRIRPMPKCSLEQDAQTINLLTGDALFACETGATHPESLGAAVVEAPELSAATAAWLAEILGIGGLLIHVYPRLRRSVVAPLLELDRCTFADALTPARHYVQLRPMEPGQASGERWRIACAGVDLYARHKPERVTLRTSADEAPLLEWLNGMSPAATLCEVSGALRRPDELIRFLDETGEEGLGARLRRMAIPPDFKYPGRWLPGKAPCLALTRIEVDAQGQVRPCRHGEPIGVVGDSWASLAQRLDELARAAEERRGCMACSNTHCPRCPFPGVDDRTYCGIMTQQKDVLRLLNQVRVIARLPFILGNQRDKMASE